MGYLSREGVRDRALLVGIRARYFPYTAVMSPGQPVIVFPETA